MIACELHVTRKNKHMKIGRFIISLIVFATIGFTSCKDEKLESEIPLPSVPTTALDVWIDTTFTKPYNIKITYKFNSADFDITKSVAPPMEDRVEPFLKAVYKIWLKPYTLASSESLDFMKSYTCRELLLIGSGSYNTGGSVTLGYAEGGYRIVLYTVNQFDMINGVSKEALDRFFRTMHHEFGHILNQRKPFSEKFQHITGNYSADWTSISDEQAMEQGFVSAYSKSAATEDFVEVYSFYVTMTSDEWNEFLGRIQSTEAVEKITEKLASVRTYLKDSYNLEIDNVRDQIVNAISEVATGNLD